MYVIYVVARSQMKEIPKEDEKTKRRPGEDKPVKEKHTITKASNTGTILNVSQPLYFTATTHDRI